MTTSAGEAPSAHSSPPVRRKVGHVMGMPVSLALRGRHTDDQRADTAWAEAMASLRAADAVFSTYRADSVISRLGRGELRDRDCPAEVAEVLELSELAREQSGGAFDVRRPDASGTRVLDPSGVVKGWAVDRAARALAALPDTDFCLSAGGDMLCRARPTSPSWRIGIENPRDAHRLVAVVPVRNGGVATSGTAHRGSHIADGRSGRAPTALASVTVVGPDLVWADIDATTAFALGADALPWLRGRTGRCGLVVWADGRVERFAGPAVKG